MSLPGHKIFRLAALLSAGHLLSASLLVQAATNPPVVAPSNSAVVGPLLPRPPMPPAPPPLMPMSRSPISFFRDLLAMNPAERKQALTNCSPEGRTQILAKVREYESLDPDERELRLRVTELRWYLLPLMTRPATNRPAQLAMIPEKHRKLIEDRLQEWDKLAPDVRKELLANEATIQYLAEIEGRTAEQRRRMIEAISPARRAALEQGITKWNSLPEDQRRKMLSRFREFFELTAKEKQKALNTLSGPERKQLEKTLRTFGNLPPDQRDQCIRSFEKFAGLSLAERQQFLKSAERWQAMSPPDRQAWRELVRKVPPPSPPPLPPPLRASLRPLPPMPPVATNRN